MAAWLQMTPLVLVTLLSLVYSVVADDVPTFRRPRGSPGVHYFEDGPQIYARYLRVEPQQPNVLYVGAMEYVYRLNSDVISDSKQFYKSERLQQTSTLANHICKQYTPHDQEDVVCKNHIRIIMVKDHDHNSTTPPVLYVCGTGARQPIEFVLDKNTLRKKGAGEKVKSLCPHHPDHSYTCLYCKKGNPVPDLPSLYTGVIRLSKSKAEEPVIYRPPIERNNRELFDLLETQSPSDNKNWLNEAVFVGSFETELYNYFFFHEKATEFDGCIDQRVSRVARVCKNDQGGKNSRSTQWTSYFKATINCSIPGSHPFRFNKIKDVKMTNTGFIAAFVIDGNEEIFGSAICKYSFQALEDAFNGDFMAQDKDRKWRRVASSDVPTPRPGSCHVRNEPISDEEATFVNNHQLMALSVQPENNDQPPHFFKMGVLFEKLVLDQSSGYSIYFIATSKGDVYKIVWLPRLRKTKLLAVYQPFDSPTKVWSMEKQERANSLYLGTDSKVVQLSMSLCSSYTSCNLCAQDPHCAWDPRASSCVNYVSNRVLRREVETPSPDFCYQIGACHKNSQEMQVRVPGSSVAFTCESKCSAENGIQWYRDLTPIDFQQTLPNGKPKYMLTTDNGLVIWNVTTVDRGVYDCRSGRFQFAEYRLTLPGCGADKECYWETEFRNWCNEFDKYQKEFNNWVCVKDQCFNNEDKCLPGAQQTCSKP